MPSPGHPLAAQIPLFQRARNRHGRKDCRETIWRVCNYYWRNGYILENGKTREQEDSGGCYESCNQGCEHL